MKKVSREEEAKSTSRTQDPSVRFKTAQFMDAIIFMVWNESMSHISSVDVRGQDCLISIDDLWMRKMYKWNLFVDHYHCKWAYKWLFFMPTMDSQNKQDRIHSCLLTWLSIFVYLFCDLVFFSSLFHYRLPLWQ